MRPGESPALIDPPANGAARERLPGAFWRPDPRMVEALAAELRGRKVLEIFGGNGLLARRLSDLGVDVLCTSLLSSMDAHERGVYHPVHDLDARQAVLEFGEGHEVLLICWPTVTDAALDACRLWGSKPVAYVGEVTDYSKNHLGGCATDEFHEAARPAKRLPYAGNMLEQAWIGTVEPGPKAAPTRWRRP